jgi:hypothetical protein
MRMLQMLVVHNKACAEQLSADKKKYRPQTEKKLSCLGQIFEPYYFKV